MQFTVTIVFVTSIYKHGNFVQTDDRFVDKTISEKLIEHFSIGTLTKEDI